MTHKPPPRSSRTRLAAFRHSVFDREIHDADFEGRRDLAESCWSAAVKARRSGPELASRTSSVAFPGLRSASASNSYGISDLGATVASS